MKRLECTSPTSMPAADVSIAHLLIYPTIPLPRPWTPSSSMHSSTSTDWRSSTATAGWQWQAAAAGARAPFGLQLGQWRPAMASSSDARQTTVVPLPENKFLPCRRGGRAEELGLSIGGRWGSCLTLPYGELRL